MSVIRVTKSFSFDMAHALYGHDGPCKNIHGHTYKLSVTYIGIPMAGLNNPKQGMVVDFADVKRIVKERIVDVFDHSLVLNALSPHAKLTEWSVDFPKIHFLPFQPTCENLLADFVQRIAEINFGGAKLFSIRLDETPTSFAEWFSSDNA